jgi:DNA-binding beta-propeller fold protein YncE
MNSHVAGAVLVGVIVLAVSIFSKAWPYQRDVSSGVPPIVDSANLYSEAGANKLSPVVAGDIGRVYVPDIRSGDVTVIDPSSFKVVDRFNAGPHPQHVVPSWDLRTLWVTGSAENKKSPGSLTPIDPRTGKPGRMIVVPDAYNMYFLPNGRSAIIVAERLRRLEFRDPKSMALQSTLNVSGCKGINHADFTADGRYAIFTCEFDGALVEIDMREQKVLRYLKLAKDSMPQDVRISPDGNTFFVADMLADGVFLIDRERFAKIGFIRTGVGAHGLYPSRDGTELYVADRGSHEVHGPKNGHGDVAVIDFKSRRVEKVWPIPGGGSPDMGNVSADGKYLWLSGRFDNVVYAIDVKSGNMRIIRVGMEPHGLTVWPQPGRFSLGHTGNMR